MAERDRFATAVAFPIMRLELDPIQLHRIKLDSFS